MSIQLIQKHYAEVETLIRYGGLRNESSLLGTVSVETMKIVNEMQE